ncbi:MAG: T9SS C-terminal target domain-containing protein [Calditrichaeota bacterium]|nr:MAG: T9SS C-terminal target domain-containing protein [Calditrichota bacterium]
MRNRLAALIILAYCLILSAQDAIVDIWNGNTPNLTEGAAGIQEVITNDPTWGTLISKVSKPIVEVYLPPADIATGTAVVICPGGGYGQLAWDHEGHQVARWFNTIGVAGLVLKYRLPDPTIVQIRHIAPIQDAHRAIRLVRDRADEWNIDPNKVGIMGFSAGGHLAGSAAVHADSTFSSVDAVDALSAAPNFLILGYPVVTMGAGTHAGSKANLLGGAPSPEMVDYFSVEKQINERTPPTFIAVARNDQTVPFEPNSLTLFNVLQAANIPSELWVYDESLPPDHGFGLGQHSKESIEWPWRLALWMKANGWTSIVPEKPRYTFLNLDQTHISLPAKAAEETVHVACDTTWNVLSKDADWFTISKENGDKVDSLALNISANDGNLPRQGQLIIGTAVREDTIWVTQATPGRFGVFVVGASTADECEEEIISTALTAGIVLAIKTDESVSEGVAESDRFDLILLSDTVSKTKVGEAYRSTSKPVMVLETGLFDKMGMTAVRAYGQEKSITSLVILNDQHELAAGLSGDQAVFTEPVRMNWGAPGEHAVNIAAVNGDPAKSAIFAYPAGAVLFDGTIAAGKRLGFFAAANSTRILTSQGQALMQAALTWMLEQSSAVDSRGSVPCPAEFALFQNYPNPFNPATDIAYHLPATCRVRLQVFDLNGRLIETLVDEVQQPGSHRVQFAAFHLSSGAYFYRLQAEDRMAVGKMLLIR